MKILIHSLILLTIVAAGVASVQYAMRYQAKLDALEEVERLTEVRIVNL